MALMLARRSPMLLLALAAIVFSVIRWKRHPRVSLMTAIAFVIYIIDAFLISILLYMLPTMITAMRSSPKMIDWLYFFVFFFVDFVSVIMIVLLVSAAFSQRNPNPIENNA
jgi:hypothetical protein